MARRRNRPGVSRVALDAGTSRARRPNVDGRIVGRDRVLAAISGEIGMLGGEMAILGGGPTTSAAFVLVFKSASRGCYLLYEISSFGRYISAQC